MAVSVPIMVTASIFSSVICDIEDNDRFDMEALVVPASGAGNAF
jgi:hypothetical protein